MYVVFPFNICKLAIGNVHPVQVDNFKAHLQKMHSNDDYLFSEEYGVSYILLYSYKVLFDTVEVLRNVLTDVLKNMQGRSSGQVGWVLARTTFGLKIF